MMRKLNLSIKKNKVKMNLSIGKEDLFFMITNLKTNNKIIRIIN